MMPPMTEQPPILFYFDFLSPYGYIGSVEVERLATRLGRRVDWRPVLLGITMFKVMGLKALPDTPLKGDYVRHDVERLARFFAVPFRRPAGMMRSLPAMRAFTWLNARDPALARRFGQAVFRRHWTEGIDLSEAANVATVLGECGLDDAAREAAIASDGAKDLLRAQVDAAIAAGVFGVPTFVVEGEMFWGADKLPMLERWIETGGW